MISKLLGINLLLILNMPSDLCVEVLFTKLMYVNERVKPDPTHLHFKAFTDYRSAYTYTGRLSIYI